MNMYKFVTNIIILCIVGVISADIYIINDRVCPNLPVYTTDTKLKIDDLIYITDNVYKKQGLHVQEYCVNIQGTPQCLTSFINLYPPINK